MRWRLAYARDLLRQFRSRSYWRMSKAARGCRRSNLRFRHKPLVLTGEAADRAVEILQRHGKL